MSKSSNRRDVPTARPISRMTIAVCAIVVLGIEAAVLILLLRRYSGAGPDAELNVIRSAGPLLVVIGGAAALLLAALRHRSTVLAQRYTEQDATERRITELYTKAADQLGRDQAPVRLAGLYALERLANSTAEHRQTIVNVICAYLRMPYTPVPEHFHTRSNAYRSQPPRRRRWTFTGQPAASPPPAPRHQQAREERQVRLTAQDILSRNLRLSSVEPRPWWQWKRTPDAAPHWPGISLDLTGAYLIDFTLAHCQLDRAEFKRAQFAGLAEFNRTQFTGDTNFLEAQFTSAANFVNVKFASNVYFFETRFTLDSYFSKAQFAGNAYFHLDLLSANVDFTGARAAVDSDVALPHEWITRPARSDESEDRRYQYVVQSASGRSGMGDQGDATDPA